MIEAKMSRKSIAEHSLREAFAPSYLEIIDESPLHAGHQAVQEGSSESHFRVKITSNLFVGKTRIEIHRAINLALKPVIDDGLHALAIEASS
jgi:BolA family transcriptional regulator, general stress-responsive regulator